MNPMHKTSGAQKEIRTVWSGGPSVQFIGVAGVCLLGLAPLSATLTGGWATSGAIFAAVFYVFALGLALRALRGFAFANIGLCNVVTVFRLMLVCGLIAALISPATGPWPVFVLATLALALDGVDGWLARRDGNASEFGAAFDMEVDAVLAMTLALHAYFGGHVGVFILALGLPRYVFWVAQFAAPWLDAQLPERFSRKVVCVVQIAVLIAVLVPFIDRPVTDILAATAALALIWSFTRDIHWLWLARP